MTDVEPWLAQSSTGPSRSRLRIGARTRRAGVTVIVAAIAILLATPALGLRGRFFGSEQAAKRVVKSFAEMDRDAPPGMASSVIAGETRKVATFPTSTGSVTLSVAPTQAGGFCFDYSAFGGGCDRARELPFGIGLAIPGRLLVHEGTIDSQVFLSGETLLDKAVTVEIRFQDGERASAPLVWVSPPINAGFFLYEIPPQHRRAGHWPEALLLTDGDGKMLAQKSAANMFPGALAAAGIASEEAR